MRKELLKAGWKDVTDRDEDTGEIWCMENDGTTITCFCDSIGNMDQWWLFVCHDVPTSFAFEFDTPHFGTQDEAEECLQEFLKAMAGIHEIVG